MSIIMHCFHEPVDAEAYFAKFCKWAKSNTSRLTVPITVEIGILLNAPLTQATMQAVFERVQEIRTVVNEHAQHRNSPVDASEKVLWEIHVGKWSPPKLMYYDAFALEALSLIDRVPFRFVVAYYCGINSIPQNIVNTKVRTDSYGTTERLKDYLCRRWVIEQKTYGGEQPQGLFKDFPTQQQLFLKKTSSAPTILEKIKRIFRLS